VSNSKGKEQTKKNFSYSWNSNVLSSAQLKRKRVIFIDNISSQYRRIHGLKFNDEETYIGKTNGVQLWV